MSEKRTSAEHRIPSDEQTTEDSDVSREEDNANRGRFVSFSDTTLQDIPTEILHCILVKAVAMEVQNMKLAKSVWKEKTDLVISRLGSVCSQWSNIFATDFFQIELHRALDGIAQETIRMEVFSESIANYFVISVSTLKDEILMFCYSFHRDAFSPYRIAVYDPNNMKDVKEVIALPGMHRGSMSACNVSNCVYVLDANEKLRCTSILRIAREEKQKFNIQTWISDLRFPISSGSLSVSDNGNIIIIQRPEEPGLHAVSVYNPHGFLQHEVMLSPDIYGSTCIGSNALQKSNGNLVMAVGDVGPQMVLMEIDTHGIIQRRYRSSLDQFSLMSFADNLGRILILDCKNRIELLDSELNPLVFTGPQAAQDDHRLVHSLRFNSEMNEVMGVCGVDSFQSCLLRIFRFKEE